jgi:carbonic anhydrase
MKQIETGGDQVHLSQLPESAPIGPVRALHARLLPVLVLLAAAAGSATGATPERQSSGAAAARPSASVQRPAPAQVAVSALAQLLANNETFIHKHDARYFAPFAAEQHPRVTVVACADSRFHMHDISNNPDGDVFVVRNIGNQIDSSQGSVQYAIEHLRTPLLLILGHVRCGAVQTAMTDYSGESPALRRELDGLHLTMQRATGQSLPSQEERWRHYVVANVHQQVRYALREYEAEVRAGRLLVVGGVYDFRGEFGGGQGRLHIININGESDRARLFKTSTWVQVEQELKRLSAASASGNAP